jgi:prophage regulatory protein
VIAEVHSDRMAIMGRRRARRHAHRKLFEGSLIMSKAPTLIPYGDLKAKGVSYSKPHLWRLERDGKFPKRVPTGPARYAYVESEIDAYQTGLIAARDAGQKA